ncbi:hypothetical protein ACFPLB_13305 [Aquamicrobium segne]|uniref:Uncharacterized protein n=1 Tax=Aquamicrobium segne TaxID=469547 RepID=A0ABW0H2E5_9HYPH
MIKLTGPDPKQTNFLLRRSLHSIASGQKMKSGENMFLSGKISLSKKQQRQVAAICIQK